MDESTAIKTGRKTYPKSLQADILLQMAHSHRLHLKKGVKREGRHIQRIGDRFPPDFNNTNKIKVLESQTFQRFSQTYEANRYHSVSTTG